MYPVREKISQEEADRLRRQKDKQSIEQALKLLVEKPVPDNSAVLAKLDQIAQLLSKLNITVEAPKVPEMDLTPIAKELAKYMAQLQHEITKLQVQSAPSAYKIEFTRNPNNGWMQSPIIVRPV